MKKEQWLKCRNKLKQAFSELPGDVQALLTEHYDTLDILLCEGVWKPRASIAGSLPCGGIYRISEAALDKEAPPFMDYVDYPVVLMGDGPLGPTFYVHCYALANIHGFKNFVHIEYHNGSRSKTYHPNNGTPTSVRFKKL